MVGWWPGEGNANDIASTNNGTLQGGATATATGFVGLAFSFDGTNGYVQIPDAPALRPTNLTIECWALFTGLDSAGSGSPGPAPGEQYLVFKQNSQFANFEGFYLGKTRISGQDKFTFQVTSSAGVNVEVDSVTNVAVGVWYHVAGVRGSNFTQLYVNGQLQGQASVTFPQDYGAHPLFFGTSGNASWDRKFKGLLDEVSLYSRALSSNEIAAIYAAGSAGKCQSTNSPPGITVQPQSQTVLVGANVSFGVTATGPGTLSYRWQRSSTNLTDGGNITGSATATLTLTNVQTSDAAGYRVVVTNSFGAVTSSVATLAVNVPTPPQVANLPATGVLATQATLNGQVTATGGDPPRVTLFYGPANGGTNAASWGYSVGLGVQTGAFAQTVTGLSSNTTYYFTARATNVAGVTWASPSQTFTTLASNPPPPLFSGVLTHHNNNARTGANLNETVLNTANVNTNQFGLLYTRPVDDQLYAQPLVALNVSIPGRGTRNLVILATVNDSVYAYDADDPTVSAPYWQTSFLGPNVVPPSSNDILASPCGTFFNISGNFGIIGTPVIDPATGTLYVVARTKEFGTNFVQRLHALDITTGLDRSNSPVTITAQYPGTNGLDSVNGFITFDPMKQNQRAGLALVNGIVYICWGSHCDWEAYHGWLMGYDAATLQQAVVFVTTPNGREGALWMSGQPPSADSSGNLYVSVANGPKGNRTNPQTSGYRVESFLKLTRSGTNFNVASSFTPNNWTNLEDGDLDLGSAGLLLIPGTTLAFSGGKEGKAYLVNRDNMGGLSGTNADTNVLQSFQVTGSPPFNNLHGGPVWWDGPDGSYAYFQGESDFLRQYKFDPTNQVFLLPTYGQSPTAAPSGMPGGFLAVSANGTNVGSGIVWSSRPISGNAAGATVPGILLAHNAQNVAIELWDSEQISARDSVGNFAKYVPPTIANGKVYLATFSNGLNVYGLFPRPTLGIRVVGGFALLSWPTNTMFTYTLQSSTNLVTHNWFGVTNQVTVSNTSFQVTIPLSGARTFYRLKR
jgi:hypothetical protein